MLARSFRRAPFQFKSAFRRPLNTNGSSATPPRFATRPILLASGGIVAGSLLYMSTRPTIHNDAAELRAYQLRHEPRSLSELARTYFVYTMCSFPTLVDWSPLILQLLTSIPGVKQITEAFVKETFFAQFVGGPTAEACLSLLERLRAENKGLLFAYSVEVDEHEAAGQSSEKNAEEPVYKRIRNEMLNAIDIASAFDDTHSTVTSSPNGRRTWVAIKMSAMVPDHEAFIKFSTYLVQSAQKAPYSPRIEFPGYPRSDDVDILTKSCPTPGVPGADMAEIFDLYQDLRKICQRAQEKHVRIILDAEYSWYQPALDCITFALMREFNKVPEEGSGATNHTSPLIYGTFQAYLRRAPELLARSLEDARNGGYALGVKLVRGAYHEQENAMHHVPGSPSISPEPHSPIWPSKEETDKSYNTCVLMLTQAIAADVKSGPVPKIGVLFGSHNWDSVRLILNELQRLGLATPTGTLPPEEQVQGHEVPDESVLQLPKPVTDRVTLGQLFGMSDGLTNYIVARTRSASPFVIKYVPYGALSEVMPYLARRAIENKSVLGNGGANEERSQAWSQIRKRFGLS